MSSREVQTIMHPLKTRLVQVKTVKTITPHLVRITLHGEDLKDFVTASPDDHVKVFFPAPGAEKPVIPQLGPQGPTVPEGSGRPIMRDFTPRRYDPQALELDLEFFVGHEGAASNWARQAQPGHYLGLGGPRGSRIVPYLYDWYLMVGDETSIPSVGRRLEEMPEGTPVIAVLEVKDPADEVAFQTKARAQVIWVHRGQASVGTPELLKNVLLKTPFPVGDYFAWIATEKATSQELKELLITVKGADPTWIKATGYW